MDIIQKQKLITKVNKSKHSKEIWEIVKYIKILKEDPGMPSDKIDEVIKSLNLPFSLHLFITGNFSNLIDCV